MASNTFDGRKTEFEAALAALEPQARGFDDLQRGNISNALRDFYAGELNRLRRRIGLLNNARSGLLQDDAYLAALIDDGYPNMDKSQVPGELFAEQQAEQSDIAAAEAVIVREPSAAAISVSLGAKTAKV